MKDPEHTKIARGLRLYGRHNEIWEKAAAVAGMEKTAWFERVLENYEEGVAAFPPPSESLPEPEGTVALCPVCGIRKRHRSRKNGICNRCAQSMN